MGISVGVVDIPKDGPCICFAIAEVQSGEMMINFNGEWCISSEGLKAEESSTESGYVVDIGKDKSGGVSTISHEINLCLSDMCSLYFATISYSDFHITWLGILKVIQGHHEVTGGSRVWKEILEAIDRDEGWALGSGIPSCWSIAGGHHYHFVGVGCSRCA